MDSTRTILIKGAHVIDPSQDINSINDILIQDGVISCVEKDIPQSRLPLEYLVYNAEGSIATPGIIDAHVHIYKYATKLGVDADERCFNAGTVTVVDAGSAGAATFAGLKEFVMKTSKTKIKAFLHIANHGLASAGCASLEPGGEGDSLNQVCINQCVDCINKNQDDIVGIKVRLSESVCNDGKNEEEIYRRALEARKLVGKPLMVHHAISSIPTMSESSLSCPGHLEAGDIYTHMYHSYIVNDGAIDPAFVDARERGVLFDVGHGMGGFSWQNAEICARQGFWPDMISTDLHTFSCDGPAYDLMTVMSKFFYLGMPLVDILAAVTINPAKALRLDDKIGSLKKNTNADVSLMRIDDCKVEVEDCHNETRKIEKRFKPVCVFKNGIRYNCLG